jgi:adenylosuccinate synthase
MPASPKSAFAVIGAAYGDEGKGLMTDALAAAHGGDAVVIRYNGGAQAGHTVTLADGRRHVFHHVGSGTFAGAKTFLSRFFVANPILLREELAALAALGLRPRIAIAPDAPVTTPYDMMLNQMAEQARGTGRHGSCGLGFGETIERCLRPEFSITADLLTDRPALEARLRTIRGTWIDQRAAILGLGPLAEEARRLFGNDDILEQWLEDAETFCRAVTISENPAPLAGSTMIFEGAQGLLLDQDHGAFPYVTRSSTGLKNILALAPPLGIERIEAVYATRAYATRHGAGPLAHELPAKPYEAISDPTNIDNAWQGSLRFGTLDLDILADAIRADLAGAAGQAVAVAPHLAMTCLDQIGRTPSHILGGETKQGPPEALAEAALRRTGLGRLATSHGPSRETIVGLPLIST